MNPSDFLSPRRDEKRYSFVWNNDEKTEALIRDKKANEIILICASEGTHSARIIEQLRASYLEADVLPLGQRLVVTKRGLFWQDGVSVLDRPAI